MKTHPILFNTKMVNAINSNAKSQTRRLFKNNKPETNALLINIYAGIDVEKCKNELMRTHKVSCGDIFWVRETFAKLCPVDKNGYTDFNKEMIFYKADGEPDIIKYDADGSELENQFMKWKPSIFMPKDACRQFLKVKNVRLELLQEISSNDAKSEGIDITDDYWGTDGARNYMWGEEFGFKHEFFFADGNYGIENLKNHDGYKASFFSLWMSIHGKESLMLNPLVWVYDFEKIEKPISF
ncbi:MAG: hypothetical protein V3V28_09020 [Polaribacter sp.]|uniref:hypothetical protein n=1 Tax=Polaribacter sp. TaxID=1920175 RepID=UPI002F35A807